MKTMGSLVVILAAAVAAPIVADLAARWVRVPIVALEIVLGIVAGPILGWVDVTEVIDFLSQFGLATLMFLAGMEIDLPRVRGRPLNRAVAGWLVSLVLGVAVGVALAPIDGPRSGLIVGLAITTTALGVLLPILRDDGTLDTPFGTSLLAGASVGELGPILAVTVLLGTDSAGRTLVVLLAFAAVIALCTYLALRERNARLARLLESTIASSGQLAVRMVVLFLVFMVWVAGELGLDVLLGAFAAGMVFRLFSAGAGEAEAEAVESKLIGLGFGFVVPVFFVVSGVTFDLDALTDNPLLLLAIPGILVLFVVVRGAPTALLHREMTGPDRRAMAVYLGTELPLVVVVTSIGVESGRLESGAAAALVGAALVSVLVFPLLAARLRPRPQPA